MYKCIYWWLPQRTDKKTTALDFLSCSNSYDHLVYLSALTYLYVDPRLLFLNRFNWYILPCAYELVIYDVVDEIVGIVDMLIDPISPNDDKEKEKKEEGEEDHDGVSENGGGDGIVGKGIDVRG